MSSSKILAAKALPIKWAGRQNYHHGDLQAAVTESAIDFVRENGPDHLSLRAVAVQVGVSPSAIYHYFPDKESLIYGVADQLFVDLATMLRQALSEIPGESAHAATLRFRAIGRTYFQWAIKEPNLFRLMFGGFCKVDKVGEHLEAEAYLILSQSLDELLAKGVISSAMRPYGELIAWSAVQGASTLIVEGLLPEPLFETLLDGLEIAMTAGHQ